MRRKKGDIREDKKMGMALEVIMEKPCTPVESLEQSLKEMIQIRRGELPKRTWEDFKRELKEDKDK